MSDVRVSATSVQGFAAVTIANGVVSFTLVPELGGKLSSICDLRTGREWLWTSDRLPYRTLPYGTSYAQEGDTGGWDECFPTVAACAYPLAPWRGTALPDHGELWPQAWRTEVADGGPAGAVRVRTTADGVVLPYRFERVVSLGPDAATLRFDYAVTSRAGGDIAFIWSAHPLLAIEPGMRVLLPKGARLRSYLTIPDTLLPRGGAYTWPLRVNAAGNGLDLARLPDVSSSVAFKLWSEPLAEGWAELKARDGALRFGFDPGLLPQVGLWLNAGGWSGTGGEPYYNLALEPCIGAQDSLEEAVERHRRYGTLPAHGERRWWLEVHVSGT